MTGSPDAAPTPARSLGADAPTKIEVGDNVEVVLRGKVTAAHSRGAWFSIGPSTAFVSDAVSVEVLTPPAPPQPAWWPPQPGDVIRYGNSTYLRESDDLAAEYNTSPRLLVNRNGIRLPDQALLDMHREDPYFVRLLVRDGQVRP